jgi:hypothetical protein
MKQGILISAIPVNSVSSYVDISIYAENGFNEGYDYEEEIKTILTKYNLI